MRPDQDEKLIAMGKGSNTCDACVEINPTLSDNVCDTCKLNPLKGGQKAIEQFVRDQLGGLAKGG